MRDLPGRTGSMGMVSPYYEVEVRDENGAPVDFEQSGMLWIKGRPGLSLFLEYLNAPEATADAFDADGWFLTGDRVTPFADGHIRFDGRKADMLRIGAENVAESEIERVILGTPGVAEVAVVGQPHPMLDQTPVAFVVAKAGVASQTLTAAIAGACENALADFKRPTAIHIVNDLPRVTLGKIDKKALRARVASNI
jgi:crotonobetaine/carnitine-CoA ligase